MKKYHIRKRKKIINSYLIFSILAIGMLLLSYGYATFSDTMRIQGTANVKQLIQSISTLDALTTTSLYGNSTYTYENLSNWMQPDGTYIYEVHINIVNLEEENVEENLLVSFDVNVGLEPDSEGKNFGILQAQTAFSNDHNIKIELTESSSLLAKEGILDLYAYLPYKIEQEKISIENLAINGRYATCTETPQEMVNETEENMVEEQESNKSLIVEEMRQEEKTEIPEITTEEMKLIEQQNEEPKQEQMEGLSMVYPNLKKFV